MLTNEGKFPKLSGLEQEIYFSLLSEDRTVASFDELKAILPETSPGTLRVIIHRLTEKGYLSRVKKGVFILVPLFLVKEKKDYSPLIEIASRMTQPYYLSHYTALTVHGKALHTLNTVFLTTTKWIKSIRWKNYLFKFTVMDKKYFFGFNEMKYKTETILVSDMEKTIVDILKKPAFCADGFAELGRVIALNFEDLNPDVLLDYLYKMNNASLYARLGYILSILSDESLINVRKSFFKELQKNVPKNYVLIFPSKEKKGLLIKEWKIIDNYGRDTIMGLLP